MESGRHDPWQLAISALARRDLTTAEVMRKLSRRDVARDEAERVVTRLVERGYVDDRKVAYNHARFRAEQGRRGPHRVRSELVRRGISDALADEAVRSAFGAEPDGAALAKAARKLCGSAGIPGDRAGRERLARRLIRAGFAPGAVLGWLQDAAGGEDVTDDIP